MKKSEETKNIIKRRREQTGKKNNKQMKIKSKAKNTKHKEKT